MFGYDKFFTHAIDSVVFKSPNYCTRAINGYSIKGIQKYRKYVYIEGHWIKLFQKIKIV